MKGSDGRMPKLNLLWTSILSLVLFLLAGNSMVQGGELTEAQCRKVGGVLTKAGCLMIAEKEKGKFKNDQIYSPDKEKCECCGGKWHETYGCLANISEEECQGKGGQVHPELGCIRHLPPEECEKVGGVLNEKGVCEF